MFYVVHRLRSQIAEETDWLVGQPNATTQRRMLSATTASALVTCPRAVPDHRYITRGVGCVPDHRYSSLLGRWDVYGLLNIRIAICSITV